MGNVLCGIVPEETCVKELRKERFRSGKGNFNRKTRRMEFREKPDLLMNPITFKRKLKPQLI